MGYYRINFDSLKLYLYNFIFGFFFCIFLVILATVYQVGSSCNNAYFKLNVILKVAEHQV